MNALVHNFDFEGTGVRVRMIGGEPWFVLNDVCRVLEIKNPWNVAARLDDDEKGLHTMEGLGGNQKMTVINESGLYAVIITSNKPEARRFRKWVTSVVLPAIRKTGFYFGHYGEEEHCDGARSEYRPSSADLRVFRMPIAKVNAAARLISVARNIYGPEAARKLWESERSLPNMAGYLHDYLTEAPEDNPVGCFQHLMRMAGWKTRSIGEMLHLALTDRTMNQRMKHFGIIPGPVGSSEPIAFANEHPFLARVFAETAWIGDWKIGLIQLPGAVKSRDFYQFGAVRCKAVLLPRAEFLKLWMN